MQRITTAEADATDALLSDAMDTVGELRRAWQFVLSGGTRSNWVHPLGPPALHLSGLADMIAEPVT